MLPDMAVQWWWCTVVRTARKMQSACFMDAVRLWAKSHLGGKKRSTVQVESEELSPCLLERRSELAASRSSTWHNSYRWNTGSNDRQAVALGSIFKKLEPQQCTRKTRQTLTSHSDFQLDQTAHLLMKNEAERIHSQMGIQRMLCESQKCERRNRKMKHLVRDLHMYSSSLPQSILMKAESGDANCL